MRSNIGQVILKGRHACIFSDREGSCSYCESRKSRYGAWKPVANNMLNARSDSCCTQRALAPWLNAILLPVLNTAKNNTIRNQGWHCAKRYYAPTLPLPGSSSSRDVGKILNFCAKVTHSIRNYLMSWNSLMWKHFIILFKSTPA